MIYKFNFAVYSNDNELISEFGEESGRFWRAFSLFFHKLMSYVKWNDVVNG